MIRQVEGKRARGQLTKAHLLGSVLDRRRVGPLPQRSLQQLRPPRVVSSRIVCLLRPSHHHLREARIPTPAFLQHHIEQNRRTLLVGSHHLPNQPAASSRSVHLPIQLHQEGTDNFSLFPPAELGEKRPPELGKRFAMKEGFGGGGEGRWKEERDQGGEEGEGRHGEEL
mgnify:CR=1 FL=1